MKVAVALCTLGGFVAAGALYACGHWIAGTAMICACGWIVSTQAPDEKPTQED